MKGIQINATHNLQVYKFVRNERRGDELKVFDTKIQKHDMQITAKIILMIISDFKIGNI